jgi:hypothetical protein
MKDKKFKAVKVKCHCPCHTHSGVKHVRPCCNGGYRDTYVPDENNKNDKNKN